MQIFNSGKRTLEITPEHMRLIVTTLNAAKWSPPQVGEETTERPTRTTYLGQHVWAIPPNADGSFDWIPPSGNRTFATHWGEAHLAPGRTFRPSYHSGDLAFYVPYLPHDPHGEKTANDVLGIAYVYGRQIVVLCPKERWGPKVPAGSF
jgi:hypothetical protein